ncbi:MAG: DUF3417 domain-containing protein, partial [Elusimicrobiota bacterium]
MEENGAGLIKLPRRIERLKDIAYNLWWSWNPSPRGLFKYVDRTLWRDTRHNPVKLLHQIRPARLDVIAKDPTFLQWYDAVVADYDDYMGAHKTWFKSAHPERAGKIAYFSAEFG